MYRYIFAALSFCSQVIQLPLFLILARKEDVVALCDWKWLSCEEGFEEIKGLACLYCSPSPGVTHCPPLQTPSTHTSSIRSNRLTCVPPNTPSIPHFLSLFNRARVANCTEISLESSQKAQELNCWISERRTIQPKWNEWKQNFRDETFDTSRGCPLLLEILEIAGLFVTGSCQKFKQEILVERNLPGGVRVEEWQGFF